ncbi:hypothetical protein [Phenylobacterium sp. J367]|nr:hypothetical protein [Phenylobacterium sp. J367]MCR5877345.1 hypothetical protein [Phenylobacterium sp. J367]
MRRRPGLAKARATVSRSRPMIGIATIAIFLAVMVALNVFEFGRID